MTLIEKAQGLIFIALLIALLVLTCVLIASMVTSVMGLIFISLAALVVGATAISE